MLRRVLCSSGVKGIFNLKGVARLYCCKQPPTCNCCCYRFCPPCCPSPCCPPPCPPCPPCPPRRIPPNPCCPIFPHGNFKRYKYLFIFVCVPLIAVQALRTLCAIAEHVIEKEPCRNYEYMRRRTKRYPWGEGEETFFHNEHINSLPSECIDYADHECIDRM